MIMMCGKVREVWRGDWQQTGGRLENAILAIHGRPSIECEWRERLGVAGGRDRGSIRAGMEGETKRRP